MNTTPPEDGRNDSVETLYRRLAKLDPSEPAPVTREAIMARAQELANSRAAADVRRSGRGPSFGWGRMAATGALAAGVVTALVIAPRYLLPGGSTELASQGHPPVTPPASQALQMAPPAPLAESRLAQGIPARPQSAVPPAAATSNAAASAPAAAPAAKSAMPESRGADVAPSAAFSNAQRAMRQSNAVSPAAVAGRPPEIAKLPEQRLRQAAEAGDVGEIAALAPGLADLNARDAQGRTAVMIATLHRQTPAVAALLSRGADPNVADVNGLTPLQAAREAGAADIVATLEHYGAH